MKTVPRYPIDFSISIASGRHEGVFSLLGVGPARKMEFCSGWIRCLRKAVAINEGFFAAGPDFASRESYAQDSLLFRGCRASP